MDTYEVVWRIEVSADTAEEAAERVNDDYLKPCEDGNWTFQVSRSDNLGSTHIVTVDRITND